MQWLAIGVLVISPPFLVGFWWKAKLVFVSFNWRTKPNLLNQIYSLGTKPNIPSQIYWTKFAKPNLQNWIYKIKSTNQNVFNAKNQIYQTKPIQSNLQNKINPIITIKPNLYKPNLQTVKVTSNSSLSWAWPSSAPACLVFNQLLYYGVFNHYLFRNVQVIRLRVGRGERLSQNTDTADEMKSRFENMRPSIQVFYFFGGGLHSGPKSRCTVPWLIIPEIFSFSPFVQFFKKIFNAKLLEILFVFKLF